MRQIDNAHQKLAEDFPQTSPDLSQESSSNVLPCKCLNILAICFFFLKLFLYIHIFTASAADVTQEMLPVDLSMDRTLLDRTRDDSSGSEMQLSFVERGTILCYSNIFLNSKVFCLYFVMF